MLNLNYTEKLFGLEDAILENAENLLDGYHLYLRMHQRQHTCPCCGELTSKVHDYRTQIVKDIPFMGRPLFLHLKKRRHKCPHCNKIFTEHIPFLAKYHRTTNRLWAFAIEQLTSDKSMKCIGKETNLSGPTIARILSHVSYTLPKLPEVLSIDEFRGNCGGEKFQCILTDPKKKKVLDILPTRKAEDLYAYFGAFKDRNQVKVVVMDMSHLFKSIVKNSFPNADIVADKFHVVRQVNWAFEAVRKNEQKLFGIKRRKYFKRSRRLLLKNPNMLHPDEFEEVANMLQISNRLAEAYYLKNEFCKFMNSKDLYEAKKNLLNWMMHAQAANLPEFESCMRTITNWQKEILNAFVYGYTNGYTEGCNNHIKVVKRIGYGFRNFKTFRLRLLHVFSN